MSVERYTPIVVGVGDALNKSTTPEDAIEPLKLMLRAIDIAIKDTGLVSSAAAILQSNVDSIDVVRNWTLSYPDLPGLISNSLGINPKYKHYHPYNAGSTPGLFFDQASRRVSLGETKVAILTGGEALASGTEDINISYTQVDHAQQKHVSQLGRCRLLAGRTWLRISRGWKTLQPVHCRKVLSLDLFYHRRSELSSYRTDLGGLHGIGAPVQGYPLYENGFRHYRRQTIQANIDESARLYENCAKIASANPNAWFYKNRETAESIKAVTKKNRMICYPCEIPRTLLPRRRNSAVCRPPLDECFQQCQYRCGRSLDFSRVRCRARNT
jgi:hypothetical protein